MCGLFQALLTAFPRAPSLDMDARSDSSARGSEEVCIVLFGISFFVLGGSFGGREAGQTVLREVPEPSPITPPPRESPSAPDSTEKHANTKCLQRLALLDLRPCEQLVVVGVEVPSFTGPCGKTFVQVYTGTNTCKGRTQKWLRNAFGVGLLCSLPPGNTIDYLRHEVASLMKKRTKTSARCSTPRWQPRRVCWTSLWVA